MMTKSEPLPASIAEQIYSLMVSELAADELFDEEAVRALQRLVDQDSLTNRRAVLKAIQVQPGEGP